jgi:outer membrane protein OmpA-like peptidoglycan-associated protein
LADCSNRLAAAQQPAAQPAGAPGGGGTGNFDGPVVETYEIAGNVLFDSGQASIKTSARRELDNVARQIQSRYGGANIRIEGHTDSDPIRKSKWGSNEALSEARAEAVMNYLSTKGISRSRMQAVGMGSSEPKSTKAASRRVAIKVLGS